MVRRFFDTVHDFFFGFTDPVRLDLFRRGIAVSLFIYMVERSRHPLEWLTHEGFHYSAAGHPHWMPGPLPLLAPWMVWPFLAAFFAAIVCVALGRALRPAILFCWFCIVYVTFADPPAAFTLNRLFIVIFTVFALAPNPVRVVDDAGASRLRQNVWPVRILQATLIVQYASAGWCKCVHGNWLEDPMVVWSQAQGHFMSPAGAWLIYNAWDGIWVFMQYGSLFLEVLTPILFTVPYLQPIGIVWGSGFHLGINLTMKKLVLFSNQMMCFYLLFIPPVYLRRAAGWLRIPVPPDP